MKYQVIFAVEQQNLALRSGQFFAKCFCKLYRRKSAANNNNSYGLHSSLLWLGWSISITLGCSRLQRDAKRFCLTSKNRNQAIPRISKKCEFYWNMAGVEFPQIANPVSPGCATSPVRGGNESRLRLKMPSPFL